MQLNPVEVSEVKFIDLWNLRIQMVEEPDKFTQWFREEISLLGYFGSAGTLYKLAAHGDPNLN